MVRIWDRGEQPIRWWDLMGAWWVRDWCFKKRSADLNRDVDCWFSFQDIKTMKKKLRPSAGRSNRKICRKVVWWSRSGWIPNPFSTWVGLNPWSVTCPFGRSRFFPPAPAKKHRSEEKQRAIWRWRILSHTDLTVHGVRFFFFYCKYGTSPANRQLILFGWNMKVYERSIRVLDGLACEDMHIWEDGDMDIWEDEVEHMGNLWLHVLDCYVK